MTFPPQTAFDILDYDEGECAAGYQAYRRGHAPVPGDNHSSGFRWGWINARKDHTKEPDGFEGVRGEFIRMVRHPN